MDSMAKYGKVDRRTLLKMMGAAGASATVISTCGTSDEISGQGLSGAKFDKNVRLATAGPGGDKNWQPGHALKFLPPEDMPTSGKASNTLAGLPKEKLLNFYRLMSTSRRWETTMKDLFLAGDDRLYGAFHTYVGEEAIAVGVMGALNDDDYIASTHRGHGHLIAKGGDLNKLSAEIFFKETGYNKGYGGSTRVITDQSGGVVSRHDYFPFGEEIPGNSSHGNRHLVTDGQPTTTYNQPKGISQKFTGQERDDESGLDYFRARYYPSALGRFTSPDPVGGRLGDPQTLNRYVYVRNNPLLFVDPSGLTFYLKCKQKSKTTCRRGYAGKYVTNKKGKRRFVRTEVDNDGKGGLIDQYGNRFTASFGTGGPVFTDSDGTTFGGRFKSGSKPTLLAGSGPSEGLSGLYYHNGLNTNPGGGVIIGKEKKLQALVDSGALVKNPGLDRINPAHPGAVNFREDNVGHSAHLPYTKGVPLTLYDKQYAQVFHFDREYPYGDVRGFVFHTGAVLKGFFNKSIRGQRKPEPPASLPPGVTLPK
jgi:RHS repeat-associated protein